MSFRTPFNYVKRLCGSVVDTVVVDVVDTSVDNVKNNISSAAQSSAKSFYTNSDVPVSLFGPGITATHYDPNRHRGAFAPQSGTAQSAQASTLNTAAANSAANVAATATASANAAAVTSS